MQLCTGDKVDLDTLKKILVTHEQHKLRSEKAEEATIEAEGKHPLPEDARGGGNVAADPWSRKEVVATRSA